MLEHLNSKPSPPSRVVIIGAGGFVGGSIRRKLADENIATAALTREELDLLNSDAASTLRALLRPDDGFEALEQRAAEATAILEGRPSTGHRTGEDGVIELSERLVRADGPRQGTATDTDRAEPTAPSVVSSEHACGPDRQADRNASRPAPASARAKPAAAAKDAAQGDIAWILDAASALGVPTDRFEQYAEKRWGKGWKLAAGGRKRALDEVTAFAEDAGGFQEKVTAEIEVFS